MSDLIEILKSLNGYWQHDSGRYLAELPDGKISDTYIDIDSLTSRPNLLSPLLKDLYVKAGLWKPLGPDGWGGEGFDTKEVPSNLYVCGSSPNNITLAYEVARQLGMTSQLGAIAIFTEPTFRYCCPHDMGSPFGLDTKPATECEGNMEDKVMLKTGQQLKRFEIPENATVLFAIDKIVTGKNARDMIKAVCASASSFEWGYGKADPLQYILCLVNQSGADKLVVKDHYDCEREFKIISLADIKMRTWNSLEEAEASLLCHVCEFNNVCPEDGECKGGIERRNKNCAYSDTKLEAINPKTNWDLLTKGQ